MRQIQLSPRNTSLVVHFISTLTYFELVLSGETWHGRGATEATPMPRHSPYPVVLSPEETHVLTARAAQYTRPYFEVQRAQMILLAAEGWDNTAIADRLQTRREVVSLWRKRFYDDRLAGLDDRPRSGRPRVFSPRGRRRRQSPRL
jgi:hypothetical protein